MQANNRSYQSQYERLNTSKLNNNGQTQFPVSGGDISHDSHNNMSNVTDVEKFATSFQPNKRHHPSSFSNLSNTTNILYADVSEAPHQSTGGNAGYGSSRYQRLLGSLSTSGEGLKPSVPPHRNKQLGPAISQYDPLDNNLTQPLDTLKQQDNTQRKSSIQTQSTRSTRSHPRPPTKGVLSARVVNDTEWKSIMTPQTRNTGAARARSISPRKATASRHVHRKKLNTSSWRQ